MTYNVFGGTLNLTQQPGNSVIFSAQLSKTLIVKLHVEIDVQYIFCVKFFAQN